MASLPTYCTLGSTWDGQHTSVAVGFKVIHWLEKLAKLHTAVMDDLKFTVWANKMYLHMVKNAIVSIAGPLTMLVIP